jgi:hypothetical protein
MSIAPWLPTVPAAAQTADPLQLAVSDAAPRRVEISVGARTLLTSPGDGLWSVATDWTDSWPSAWVHGCPGGLMHGGHGCAGDSESPGVLDDASDGAVHDLGGRVAGRPQDEGGRYGRQENRPCPEPTRTLHDAPSLGAAR